MARLFCLGKIKHPSNESFFDLLVTVVFNLVFCLREKSETKSMIIDTAFTLIVR
jgi:hypothetical protein